jgi:U3 small nucleolar RNA-associated protein 25
MPPSSARSRWRGSSRGRLGGGRGKTRGKARTFTQRRSHFKASRLEEDRWDISLGVRAVANACREDSDAQIAASQFEQEESFDEETQLTDELSDDETELNTTANSYAVLLQALKAPESVNLPARKRRKLSSDDVLAQGTAINGDHSAVGTFGNDKIVRQAQSPAQEGEDIEDVNESDSGSEADAMTIGSDYDEDGHHRTSIDPYEGHFALAEADLLTAHLAASPEKRWTTQPTMLVNSVRVTTTLPSSGIVAQQELPRSPHEMKFKKRLSTRADQILEQLDQTQQELAAPILRYMDTISGARRLQGPAKLTDVVALHALDHVFKTRDHVIKNNARLSQQDGNEPLDLRDQGFTRPKVLFLLPTRQSCVKLVDSLVSICEPEQQEYKARFRESFDGQEDKTWDDKPEDFSELFSGNDDDMFRIGLKFTRKTVKFFSAFYSSDIIIASPLGLRNAIENSGDGKEKKKGHDADFLSSIEIVVVDHANALHMQNWQHVEYVFSQLNLLPKEAHGCDFSRVRPWYLDKHARHLRQTIILSDFIIPEINALATAYMLNIAGKVKFIPTYKGAMLDLPPSIPPNTSQTFLRYDSLTPAKDPNARFQYFTSTIIASLVRDRHSRGTLIFIPSSFDFIRLRNYFATSNETESLSFGAISEYTTVRDVMRTRSHFLSGRHSVLLYSERAHHFRRYRLKGVQRAVFYGLPENPLFWPEVAGFLGVEDSMDERGGGKGSIKAIFSKWDILKLERIVGTERVKKLVADRGGDMFDFV